MKIALIQQSNSAERANNKAKLEQNIRDCASQGAELIVLQELHNGLYFCQTEDPAVFEQAFRKTCSGLASQYSCSY